MAPITDTGIVTIYDTKNDNKPLTVHRIDAKEFLACASGRWSSSPEEKDKQIDNAKELELDQDSGEAMRLKGLSFTALKAMAKKTDILDWELMKKSELIEALLSAEKPIEE